MALSNTFNYAPTLGELTLYAFYLAGVKPAEITQQHMFTARTAAMMLLARWSAQTPNLWSVDLQQVPLIPGQTTYAIMANTVAILDAYVTQGGQDRIILPISRSEYATYPNKTQTGSTTVYWFDRLLAPSVTLWAAPDASQTFLNFYRVRQAMDANFVNGGQVEIPFYWLEAFAEGLAKRLARIWNPQLADALKADADESYAIAADQNVETSAVYIAPQISGYFR